MFDACIYFNLSALTRKVTKIWQDEFERLGLSPSHGYLLFAIAEKPGTSQKDLSALMELDASTVTRFIDTLIQRGLLEKTARGKGVRPKITPEGRRLCREIKKTLDGLYGKMQDHFGEKRFENFVGDLYNARQSFEETQS